MLRGKPPRKAHRLPPLDGVSLKPTAPISGTSTFNRYSMYFNITGQTQKINPRVERHVRFAAGTDGEKKD